MPRMSILRDGMSGTDVRAMTILVRTDWRAGPTRLESNDTLFNAESKLVLNDRAGL
jgi:hypothetical protein